MKMVHDINVFYYSAGPVSFKISASSLSISSIDFTEEILPSKKTPGHVINILLKWFDEYSAKKKNPLYRIVLLEKGKTPDFDQKNMNCLVLDTSCYTELEVRVYRELIKIRPGETISYKELAERSCIKRGARFIGNVMAKNRFPVIIPCHRVVRSDGTIGNYSGGVQIKQMLLDHESGGFSPA